MPSSIEDELYAIALGPPDIAVSTDGTISERQPSVENHTQAIHIVVSADIASITKTLHQIESLRTMDELPDDVRTDLESHANVLGTAIGPKRINGQPTGEKFIIVFVDHKRPREHLDDEDIIPETIDIDGEEIPVDVQEVGNVRARRLVN